MAAFFTLLLSTSQAFAYGFAGNAKVVEMKGDQNGKGMVLFDQLSGGTATCTIYDSQVEDGMYCHSQ